MSIEQELIDRRCLAYSGQGGVPECQWIGTSGAHLSGYFCLDPASPDLVFIKKIARELIAPFIGLGIKTVVTPATGSIPLSLLVTEELMAAEGDDTIKSVWADKVIKGDGTKGFDFTRPGFSGHVAGQKVLLVEDVINRQHTASQVIELIRAVGGELVGVTTVAAQGKITAESLDVPSFHKLCEINYDAWEPEQCTLEGPCSRKSPIVADPGLGHGQEHQQAHSDYQGGYITLL